MTIRKLVLALAALVIAYQLGIRSGVLPSQDAPAGAEANAPTSSTTPREPTNDLPTRETSPRAPPSTSRTSGAIAEAYEARQSNVQVESTGTVERVLKDDNDGSRHQRFIVRIPSGPTVLIAHNIDLAPRVDALREGDTISFSGEYEWNDRGGVVHWTHHDPSGRHVAGWIKHDGRVYQ